MFKVGIFVQLSGGYSGPDGMAAGFSRQSGGLSRGQRLRVDLQPARRAAISSEFLRRSDDHQLRLWRARRHITVHHRVGFEHYFTR